MSAFLIHSNNYVTPFFPLLFLVYVNDMPSQVKNGHLLQYTDDTAMICSAASPEVAHRLLSGDLLCLTRWITQS